MTREEGNSLAACRHRTRKNTITIERCVRRFSLMRKENPREAAQRMSGLAHFVQSNEEHPTNSVRPHVDV